MTAGDKPLTDYLNDHLAGSSLAIELMRQSHQHHAGSPRQQDLGSLVDEIQEDRETLLAVLGSLGEGPSPVKEAGGWVAEKVSRLKFQAPLGADPEVNRLLEVEAMLCGIFGKRQLWRMLSRVAPGDPRLRRFDFAALEVRAEAQLDKLETFRLETFAGAFPAPA